MNYRSIMLLGLATAAVLLVPLIAMQFTDEVVWTPSDFVFAGALIFGAGLVYLLVASRLGTAPQRRVLATAIVAGVLLLWAHGAVGIW